jgi:hypothetical protein
MSNTTMDEIPKQDWSYFFDTFSLRHRGWVASLELVGEEIGDQTEANRLRFEGITFETGKHAPESVEIRFGTAPYVHVSHTIVAPRSVRIERTTLDNGTFETLGIERDDGPLALVRFHAGVTPEMEELDD